MRLRGGHWNLDAYLAQQHIQVSSRRRGPGLEDMALRALGKTRRIRLRCQSHAAACRIAAQTDLIATIPAAVRARDAGERFQVALLPAPLEGLNIETYMYWPENADGDAANRWLREQLRTTLQVSSRCNMIGDIEFALAASSGVQRSIRTLVCMRVTSP